jgi:4-amino-4-deoxy-L-arabinose transferase-like glycosyltransferase
MTVDKARAVGFGPDSDETVDLGPVPDRVAAPYPAPWSRRWARAQARVLRAVPVVAVLAVAAVPRFWHLTAIGYNSDESVYAGTAASIAGDTDLGRMFPIFRAHPVLFQMVVSLAMRIAENDWVPRAVAATIGVATVAVTYQLGNRLYGRTVGLLAGLILAVMPYHVVVSRQVLLDGLMTLCASAALLCAVRYVETQTLVWLLATGSVMGLAVLSKETSVILLGGLYAFFALTPVVRLRIWYAVAALACVSLVALPLPIAMVWLKQAGTGQHYLLWQLFRRPNHDVWFYADILPGAIGAVVLIAAAVGLLWLRRTSTWRERLLVCWIAAPAVFFTLWSVKGYQYLLPIAPAVAVLAGRTIAAVGSWEALGPDGVVHRAGQVLVRRAGAMRSVWPSRPGFPPPAWLRLSRGWAGRLRPGRGRVGWQRPWWRVRAYRVPAYRGLAMVGVAALTLTSLAIPTWHAVNPAPTLAFLSGTGGLPGGREAGQWVRGHVPQGAQLLAIGPSLANVLQFYGRRRVRALSVSSNPSDRNPAYEPVPNPDRALRDGEFQYIVWDSYTAARAQFFATKARHLIDRYHGVAVYTGTVVVRSASGVPTVEPVIVIYRVRAQ